MAIVGPVRSLRLKSTKQGDRSMDSHQGLLSSLPKELKLVVLTQLDARSLASLMRTNKWFNNMPSDIGFWKHYCLSQWRFSPGKLKKLEPLSSTINWHREYKILAFYSRRIFLNTLNIRPDDESFVKPIDEDRNSIFFHSTAPDPITYAVQSRFKLYPLPWINFAVSYYELTVEELNSTLPAIGIGIALKGYCRAFPGWGVDSYALHGDDGNVYSQSAYGTPHSELWNVGDTIGLGINHAKKEIFVTRNGTLLGSIGTKVRNLLHMYATVGIRTVNNKCRVNFGQRPFVFNVVDHAQSIEHNEEFSQKWPVKLYSQIIQEFECIAFGDENPDDVEEEKIGTDYYERPVINTEPETDHAQKLTSLEEMYCLLLEFESESVQRGIQENNRELRNQLTVAFGVDVSLLSLAETNGYFLKFQLVNKTSDPNQPLADIVAQVQEMLTHEFSQQYVLYLISKHERRLERETKDPCLITHRTQNDKKSYFAENIILFLADERFPNDHPLLKFYLKEIGLEEVHLENITDEIRVEGLKAFALRTFSSYMLMKRSNRGKQIILESRKGSEFESLFGNVPGARTALKTEDSSAADVDIFQAVECCFNAYYRELALSKSTIEDEVVLLALSWWQCSAEIPLAPTENLQDFHEKCIRFAEERIYYYEDDLQRFESVMRGTIKLLTEDEEKTHLMSSPTLMHAIVFYWRDITKPILQKHNFKVQENVLLPYITSRIRTKLYNSRATFETLQKLKQERNAERSMNSGKKENNNTIDNITSYTKNKNDDDGKAKKYNGWQKESIKSWMPIVASISIVYVALASGAYYWLRKQSRR